MLAKEESLFPSMYANLRRALVPLMDDSAYDAMKRTQAEVWKVVILNVRSDKCAKVCTKIVLPVRTQRP